LLFDVGYLLLVPLLTRNKKISGWASRLNFPVAPLYTGVFSCLSYGIARFFEAHLQRTYPAYPYLPNMANESKESFAAFLFLVVAWTMLQQARKARVERAGGPNFPREA